MNILEYIDELYKEARVKYDIPQTQKTFNYFIPIRPTDKDTHLCNFLIFKQEKAKLLFLSGKQRIFLSDLNIIRTILNMDQFDISWFMKQFVLLYNGLSHQVQFEIESKIFTGIGISKYPKTKQLLLFSDSLIDVNDFIFLLNFVFSKDICWESMVSVDNFSKRTLCKYISLIDYYSTKAQRSAKFLESIGYPVESRFPVDNNRVKSLFSQTEKFDVALYA